MKEKLETHAEDAVMSKKLATIYREVPLEHSWEDMVFNGISADTAYQRLPSWNLNHCWNVCLLVLMLLLPRERKVLLK